MGMAHNLQSVGPESLPLLHFSRPYGYAAQRQNENIPYSWKGDALPNPPRREGEGETRFPHVPTAFLGGRRPPKPSPQGGGWGNPVSPCPNRILGRATPSQTLPAGRGMGKPGFPMSQPLVGAAGAPTGRGLGTPRFPVCSPQEAWGERILSHLRKHSTFGEAKTLQSSVPYNPE